VIKKCACSPNGKYLASFEQLSFKNKNLSSSYKSTRLKFWKVEATGNHVSIGELPWDSDNSNFFLSFNNENLFAANGSIIKKFRL
jgi:hypothetical protein